MLENARAFSSKGKKSLFTEKAEKNRRIPVTVPTKSKNAPPAPSTGHPDSFFKIFSYSYAEKGLYIRRQSSSEKLEKAAVAAPVIDAPDPAEDSIPLVPGIGRGVGTEPLTTPS
jgi:hypothetical protein